MNARRLAMSGISMPSDGTMDDRAAAYADTNRARFVGELADLIRFPSVSAQPGHREDVRRCAEWLAEQLRGCGLEHVRAIPTRRHPLVYGDWLREPGKPTVLVYGHYDVQPVDPLSEWRSPPCEPRMQGSDLYGRGASDDKGQLYAHVKALEACMQAAGRLPVNVKCLFEGEEEIGSPSLRPFVVRNSKALRADVVVLSDMRILAPDRPAITYALRGMLALELQVLGPEQDLHSGTYGGAVHNPAQALCEIVARLHDESGRVAIPGFYGRVRTRSVQERAYLARVGPPDTQMLNDARVHQGWGERGFSLYERTTLRPACTVNGITAGYQGRGPKSVLPASATAKISFRLVPDQRPREIERLFGRYVERLAPPTVRCLVRTVSRAHPIRTDRRHPAVRAAAVAYRKGFGEWPAFLPSGGTIGPVSTFQDVLGAPVVLLGFALPDDNMHAPNEKFHLPNFYRGIRTCIAFLKTIGSRQPWTAGMTD